eukprot:Protomagalhaensia_wolfi_Nauph_80__6355@NODE_99_length_3727_cov_66_058026_g75_i0_p4_GENE_NODE_99_length_3727_cov_66_058026_g75_i0NODE_99_length_3727_cov_66_058026_g75_i0_p4_ORF_typecomplete_len188_score7_57zfC2HC_2/PF13913_6/1_6e04zfC2HC_2/PF13913_6/0_15zfC2HC_2/PF13913_6/1_6e07zfCpG_bind_C/PF12269_8/24zfCpG_bind_C/PF12269_8/11zfCpG_bind_C/PF12269_8/0_72cSKI_SMAD_bind/PF08782_10/0_0026cSKI_SMAD_bind/PF08782_10/4_1e02cSKI_SMAD_bind/PF08782_10/6_3e03OrsD/PF12013_8/0_73OrsD/PF12013_8/27ADD_ATRX/PF17
MEKAKPAGAQRVGFQTVAGPADWPLCIGCGKKISNRGMKFHKPNCARSQGIKLIQCSTCSELFWPQEFDRHKRNCGRNEENRNRQRGSGLPPPETPTEDFDRLPCASCGRRFNPARIDAHQNICFGLQSAPKRPPFNSFRQREASAALMPNPATQKQHKPPATAWRRQHAQLQASMKDIRAHMQDQK